MEFFDKQELWRAKRVYSDNYICYQEVIGAARLRQGKRNTYKVEQNNALQRHWLGRFRRRSQIVTRSWEMLEKTLALFQRFRINGSIDELLSLKKLSSRPSWILTSFVNESTRKAMRRTNAYIFQW
jgi:insertion element IS1 protein InsB